MVLAGAGSLGLGLMVVLLLKGPTLALAVPIGLVLAGSVVIYPFLGLFLVILFSHLDALANILLEELPISGLKVLTFLTLAGVVLNSAREPRRERLGTDELALRLAVLFGVALLVSSVFAEHLDLAANSLRRSLSLLVLFYLVIRLTQTLRKVEILLVTIVVATLLSSLIVVWDFFHEGLLVTSLNEGEAPSGTNPSATSGATNLAPTHAATMLLAGTTLSLMLALRIPRWRLLAGLTALVGGAAQVLTFARAATLVFAFALVWYLFKFRGDHRFPLVLGTFLVIAAGVIPFIPDDYWVTMSKIGDIGSGFSSDLSLRRRMAYHVIGFDLLAQHPLLGVGPGNFGTFFIEEEYRWVPGRTLVPRAMHNMYLSVAVEAGLVAVACFAGMLLAALWGLVRVLKHARSEEARLLAETLLFSSVSFFLVSASVPNLFNKYTWVLPGLAVALARIALPTKADTPSSGRG